MRRASPRESWDLLPLFPRGPSTIETVRALGALDKLGLIVLPLLIGEGMRLTDSLSPEAEVTLESEGVLPGGPVEIVYACS
jgi:hypothetical protein